jgi:hypothetical protein
MATTLEVKYFNTFLLKKLKNVVDANPAPTAPYENIPFNPPYAADTTNDWYIEESRIRGGYNNTTVDFGVKAYVDEDNPIQQNRINTLIYSGIFNSRTGINQTNQFSVGEDITRSVDPANGSIQKLYAEDTNLIIFQEDKVSRALIDKDAIYSAEGNAAITSTKLVIGQIVPYAGDYGISTDPFSFAVYGYRKYFTDRKRGCVLRLSTGGEIVEISGYGMHDFFRDELSASSTNKIVGGWDMHTKNYILSIQSDTSYKTLSFDESVQGWTSFFTYKPKYLVSLANSFYSLYDYKLYLHNTGYYGTFYDTTSSATVTVVLNRDPSVIKNFKTFNYEGNDGWKLSSLIASSGDIISSIDRYEPPSATSLNTLAALETNIFAVNFKRKENKYFANLINNSGATPGEVLWGPEASGIKGFFSTAIMTLEWNTIDATDINYYTNKKELFAVSSDTVESSY